MLQRYYENNPILARVDGKAYPDLLTVPGAVPYPGGVIVEQEILTCIRYYATAAVAISPFVWVVKRAKLPSDARSNYLWHHALFSAAAYGTNASIAAAVVKSLYEGPRRFPSVDDVCKRAVWLRKDKETDRWSRTSAKMSVYGTMVCVLMHNHKSLIMRVSMGIGLGVITSVPISYTKLDLAVSLAA